VSGPREEERGQKRVPFLPLSLLLVSIQPSHLEKPDTRGPVVRTPVNTNLGLKFNQGS